MRINQGRILQFLSPNAFSERPGGVGKSDGMLWISHAKRIQKFLKRKGADDENPNT